MPKEISASLVATGLSFGVVVSRFNDAITSKLLSACLDTLVRHGAKAEQIDYVWVPGTFEVPWAAQALAESGRFDAVICLACLIRGETPHFDYIASEAAKGIASVGLSTRVPVIFGVVTAEDTSQALERAGIKRGNRGRDAAVAAIEMANLRKQLGQKKK